MTSWLRPLHRDYASRLGAAIAAASYLPTVLNGVIAAYATPSVEDWVKEVFRMNQGSLVIKKPGGAKIKLKVVGNRYKCASSDRGHWKSSLLPISDMIEAFDNGVPYKLGQLGPAIETCIVMRDDLMGPIVKQAVIEQTIIDFRAEFVRMVQAMH